MTQSPEDFDTVPYCDGDIICFLDFYSVDLWHKTQFRLSFCKSRRITEPNLKNKIQPWYSQMGLYGLGWNTSYSGCCQIF